MKLLLEQVRYNQWAVDRYVKAIAQLDIVQLKRSVNSSFPSILETLGHMLWAEELWFERWQGHSFDKLFNPADYPTLEFVNQRLKEMHAKQISLLASYEAGTEDRRIRYGNFRDETWEYSLTQMVQHLVFHSTYHRGQLATMLRQLGKVPPKTGYLVFVDEQSSAGAKSTA
jgi:uncharacterized damage-inducible protein DinB